MAVAGLPTATLALVFGIVFFGGVVKGTVGFGYAIASTAILAAVIEPATAVVIMIIPTLVANASLLGELDRRELATCLRRFWPYLGAAAVGTALGMALLGAIPRAGLALAIGALTLAYVAVKQPWAPVPGEAWVAERCFTTGGLAKVGVGLVSGVVFGAANIGVQVVAYLDSLDLDRRTFVGVLAMILVGIASLRIVLAWGLGLYASGGVAVVSVAAAVPGVAGVAAGRRLRRVLPERYQLLGALAVLSVIGVRLTLAGLGIG